jgi:hypothetical protein
LGVNISPLKTLVGRNSFEFVKRVFVATGEISPISFSSFKSATSDFSSLVSLVKESRNRGLLIADERVKHTIMRLYSEFCSTWYIRKNPNRLRRKLSQIEFNLDFIDALKGELKLPTLINTVLAGLSPIKVSDTSVNSINRIIGGILKDKILNDLDAFGGDLYDKCTEFFRNFLQDSPEQPGLHPIIDRDGSMSGMASFNNALAFQVM